MYMYLNPLAPELFAKNTFLDILEILNLDMSQISSNLIKKVFAHDRMPFFPLALCLATFLLFNKDKGDDIRSGTKDNTHHGQLLGARESMG